MLKITDLSKSYGENSAVSALSLEIKKGQVLGLLGPNGAGKTTTMRMLTTFLAPTSGTAEIAGFDICKEPEKVRSVIGYLPEQPPLYLELKVKEYLNFVGKIRGLSGKKLKSSISEMTDRCGLNSVYEKLCGELSKGYKQRVGIAQALIHNPQVIILDEPTSGLDPEQIIQIRALIEQLQADHTVILSTHILSEVMEICSQVAIISKGKLVVFGTLAELTQEKSLEKRFLESVSGV
jgi:ABC-2 type transport system ATP-binding protein